MAYEVYVGPIGLAHPDPEIAFEIELEILEGESFDVAAGLRSQWPFWARLSRALRVGRVNEWFGKPEHKAFLSKCERHVTHGEPLPYCSATAPASDNNDRESK